MFFDDDWDMGFHRPRRLETAAVQKAFAAKRYSALRELGLSDKEVRRIVDVAHIGGVDDSISLYRDVRRADLDPAEAGMLFHRASQAGSRADAEGILRMRGFKLPPDMAWRKIQGVLIGASIICQHQIKIPAEKTAIELAFEKAGMDATPDRAMAQEFKRAGPQ